MVKYQSMPLNTMANKIPELREYINRQTGLTSWDIAPMMEIIDKKNPNHKDFKLHSIIGTGNTCTVVLQRKTLIEKLLW